MQCGQFESRLNDLLDRRREPALDRLLSEHAEDCDRCRGLLGAYERALEGARSFPLPRCSAAMGRSVLAEVERPTGSRSLMWRWAAGLSAAAAALAGVMLAKPPLPTVLLSVAVNERPAARLPVPSTVAVGAPRLALGALARQATAQYADLAVHTRASWSEVMWLVPGQKPREPSMDSTNSPSTELAPPDDEPLLEVASTFKPLTDSTFGAVDFLLGVLPAGETCSVPESPAQD